MPKLSAIPKNVLAQFYGGATKQQANSSIRWSDTGEDRSCYRYYLKKYYNPDLPQEYQLIDDWSYEFNSLGYRGENYDPTAKFHIYTCGCSYTYGLGIKYHQTFSHVFKDRFALDRKVHPNEVNLLNSSQNGGSNDYIARTIIAQCSQIKPDLALVLFTTKERIEHVSETRIENIGSWVQSEGSKNYFKIYTDEMGMINLLKNIILVQQFFRLNSISNLLSVYCYHEFSNPRFNKNPIISQLMDQVDWNNISPFSLLDYRCDVGKFSHHPGPLSNLCFGRKLFVFYKKLVEASD